MIRKKIVWFGIKLYGLIGKLYGLERNCMVSNHESYGLGRVWGRQVCLLPDGIKPLLEPVLTYHQKCSAHGIHQRATLQVPRNLIGKM